MKKSLLFFSVVLLIAGLFISCNSEAAGSEEDLVYVTFEDEGKSLDSSITTWSAPGAPNPNSLKWYYKASKASGAQVGAKSSWTPVKEGNGLTGTQIGPFSVGNWKFEVIGCDPDLVPTSATVLNNGAWNVQNKVRYAGVSGSNRHTEASNVKLVRGTTTTIPVTVASFNIPTAQNTISISYDVTYNAGHNDELYYKFFVGGDAIGTAVSATPSGKVLTIESSQAHVYEFTAADFTPVTVSFKVYEDQNCSEDFEVAEGSVSFPGLKGSTVAISGTLEDLGYAYGEFGNPEDLTPPTPTSNINANDVAYVLHGGVATGFTTLEAAVVAARSGDTIGLLKDVDYSSLEERTQIRFNLTGITLDLNGHTITTKFIADIEQTTDVDENTYESFGGTDFVIKNGTITGNSSYGLHIGWRFGKSDTTYTGSSGVIKDVTIKHGLNVGNASNVTLDNVTIENEASNYRALWCQGNSVVRLTNNSSIIMNHSASGSNVYNMIGVGKGETQLPIDKYLRGTIIITSGNYSADGYPLGYEDNDEVITNKNTSGIFIEGGTFDANPYKYVTHSTHKVYANASTNPSSYIVVASDASHTGYDYEITTN